MRRTIHGMPLVFALAFVAMVQATASAQVRTAACNGCDAGLVRVDGFYESMAPLRDTFDLRKFLEPETVTAESARSRLLGFDITGRVRVWRDLAIGGGFSRAVNTTSATV